MKITASHQAYILKRPFIIARGSRTQVDVVEVSISHKGVTAYGECTPYARYGESIDSVIKQIEDVAKIPDLNLVSLQSRLPAGAARNALDCAFRRLAALLNKQAFLGHELIGSKITTALTVSIDTPNNMANEAREYVANGAKLLKVKLDEHQVIERVSAIHAVANDSKIVLDANEAWANLDLPTLCSELKQFNLAMIEQPVPAGKDHLLDGWQHPIKLCADESCHTRADLDNLSGRYEMINIKLDKTGGLTEALALADEGKARGFEIMVGCMLGSSLAIEACLPLTPFATICDLDAPYLLAQDREPGLNFGHGQVLL